MGQENKSWKLALRVCLSAAAICLPKLALADESGVSVWLPGSFGSLAATQAAPGWSVATVYYHGSVWGGGNVAAAEEIRIDGLHPTIPVKVNLDAKVNAQLNLGLIVPSYVFATPVLGGQAALSITGFVGSNESNISGRLFGSIGQGKFSRSASVTDTLVSGGDLYPQGSLRWADGVNNFMVYTQETVPVGSYDSDRLANLGANHWAVDAGGGYTYFNTSTGREASAVAGFTYNFENTATDYQNGVDFHLDWGASQFLSQHLHVGLVGYVYDQVSADSGSGDKLGSFQSRVLGVGPQVGYIFSISGHQAYLNLKGYGEFAAQNRPSGWNCWVTLSTKL